MQQRDFTTVTLGFIGAGNITEAFISGFINISGIKPAQIIASDIKADRREYIQSTFGIEVVKDNTVVMDRADIVFLAVKPQILKRVLKQIANSCSSQQMIISLAAGYPLSLLHHWLPADVPIVRAMPNFAAVVGESAIAFARGETITDEQVETVSDLMGLLGTVVEVEEEQLDAVTGLSGSGPAYIFLVIDALSDAGVKVGLSRRVSQKLAIQTVLGAAKLLFVTKEHPSSLKDKITSPGGTAIAGIHVLEEGRLRSTLIKAVESATERSRALGFPSDIEPSS